MPNFCPSNTNIEPSIRPEKQYFKILQAIHHAEVVEKYQQTGELPVGMSRQANKLTAFIKPSSPSDDTREKVRLNTENWMQANMLILKDHYDCVIAASIEKLPAFNQVAMEKAIAYGKARYKNRLTNTVLTEFTKLINNNSDTSLGGEENTGVDLLPTIGAEDWPPLEPQLNEAGPSRDRGSQPRGETCPRTWAALPRRARRGTASSSFTGDLTVLAPRPEVSLAPTTSAGRPRDHTLGPNQVPCSAALGLDSDPQLSGLGGVNPLPVLDPNPNHHRDVGPNPNHHRDVGPNPNHHRDMSPNPNHHRDVGPNPNHHRDEESRLGGVNPLPVQDPNPNHHGDVDLDPQGLGGELGLGGSNPLPVQDPNPNHHGGMGPNPQGEEQKRRTRMVEAEIHELAEGSVGGSDLELESEEEGAHTSNVAVVMSGRILDSPEEGANQGGNDGPMGDPGGDLGPPSSPLSSTSGENLVEDRRAEPTMCGPTRHSNTSQKIKNWALRVEKPVLILGDSNLARIPRYNYPSVQVDAFPGAQIHHLKAVLGKLNPQPRTRIVVLSVGLNNGLRGNLLETIQKQFQQLVAMTKKIFPRAAIVIPQIHYSKGLEQAAQLSIRDMNTYIRRTYRTLEPIEENSFKVVPKDPVHWTGETAGRILDHWMEQLK